jgi:hypothetical protein
MFDDCCLPSKAEADSQRYRAELGHSGEQGGGANALAELQEAARAAKDAATVAARQAATAKVSKPNRT